jgi:hypothetical protein
MIEKMLKFTVRWQVENDSDILYCPTPDVQFMYEKITQEDLDGLDPKEFNSILFISVTNVFVFTAILRLTWAGHANKCKRQNR